MSFFKDFKADFTQAMNELMPDGNEMYDEDEIIDEASGEEETVKPKEVKEKQAAQPKKEKKEQTVQTPEKRKVKAVRAPKEVPLKSKVSEDMTVEDDLDIAPEDMMEQIDDLLDDELYSDDKPQMLLNDDMEVNTMDMSVEELLSQLSEKQEASKITPIEDDIVEEKSESQEGALEEKELSIDDLLNQLENSIPKKEEGELSAPVPKPKEDEPVLEEPQQMEYSGGRDLGLEALLESLNEKEKQLKAASEAEMFSEEDITESETVEEEEEPVPEQETVQEEEKTVSEQEAEEVEETMVQEPVEEIEDTAASQPEMVEQEEETDLELDEENAGKSELEEAEEIIESNDVAEKQIKVTEPEMPEKTVKPEVVIEKSEEVIEERKEPEENKMSEEKGVISINSVEEEKTGKAAEEAAYNLEDVDTETTYITKGTKLTGDLETDGSIDIIGTIEGSVSCKGKVVIGGNVTGNITAGEVYANSAKINGDIKSYGSVKVGVGSVIVGGIEGESAVIAGAVNGDIDVKGPVIVDSTAVIMGNIKSRSVQINNGAVIEGFCSQSYSDIDVKSFFA